MNQRIETEPATLPDASSAHMALVLGIANRGRRTFDAIADAATMFPDDQFNSLGDALDDLDALRACIVSARDGAGRLAQLESELDSDNGGYP